MQLDLQPSAQASYARTLVSRGCPQHLAQAAAAALAVDEESRSQSEQQLIEQAWASVSR